MATAVDYFSGAGGASTGARQAGFDVIFAANHWPYAVELHAANHPETVHACVDIDWLHPRDTPYADVAWFSPSCVFHTRTRGAYSITDAAKAGRSTMWDVAKFVEWHRYPVVIVENVVDVTAWPAWPAWRAAMAAFGYEVRTVCLNSAHCSAAGPAVPQSRDRLYIVATRTRSLDLTALESPASWCPTCEETVRSWRAWSNAQQLGKHRSGYRYTCPQCLGFVAPDAPPARSVIDFTDHGRPLDGAQLAANTMRRIRIGLERYDGAPFIAELRGGSSTARSVEAPLATITARGRHHMLVHPVNGALHYRMLRNVELAAAQGFPPSYLWHGSAENQLLGIGNAVSTNVARDLMAAAVAALN